MVAAVHGGLAGHLDLEERGEGREQVDLTEGASPTPGSTRPGQRQGHARAASSMRYLPPSRGAVVTGSDPVEVSTVAVLVPSSHTGRCRSRR